MFLSHIGLFTLEIMTDKKRNQIHRFGIYKGYYNSITPMPNAQDHIMEVITKT